MGAPHELRLPPGQAVATAARAHQRVLGAAWNEHVRDTALLLASELVTNAVRYGHSPVVLQVSEQAGQQLLRVSDASTTPLASPVGGWRMPSLQAEGGRGLPLLQLLAERWGSHLHIDRDGRARHVMWFALPRGCSCCARPRCHHSKHTVITDACSTSRSSTAREACEPLR